MKEKDLYEILLEEYNESNWEAYTNSFPEVSNVEDSLVEIPMDIIRPLKFILGYDYPIYEWLNKKYEVFHGKSPIEMLKTDEGTKVLRAFIMRMPL